MSLLRKLKWMHPAIRQIKRDRERRRREFPGVDIDAIYSRPKYRHLAGRA